MPFAQLINHALGVRSTNLVTIIHVPNAGDRIRVAALTRFHSPKSRRGAPRNVISTSTSWPQSMAGGGGSRLIIRTHGCPILIVATVRQSLRTSYPSSIANLSWDIFDHDAKCRRRAAGNPHLGCRSQMQWRPMVFWPWSRLCFALRRS